MLPPLLLRDLPCNALWPLPFPPSHVFLFFFFPALFCGPPSRSRSEYKMSSQNHPGARAKAKARGEATAKAPPVPLSAPCGNRPQRPPDVDVARSRSPPTLGRSNEEVMAMGQCWDLGELGLKVPTPTDRSSAAFITWAHPKTAAHWRKPGSREDFARMIGFAADKVNGKLTRGNPPNKLAPQRGGGNRNRVAIKTSAIRNTYFLAKNCQNHGRGWVLLFPQ